MMNWTNISAITMTPGLFNGTHTISGQLCESQQNWTKSENFRNTELQICGPQTVI